MCAPHSLPTALLRACALAAALEACTKLTGYRPADAAGVTDVADVCPPSLSPAGVPARQQFTVPWGGTMHLRGVFVDHLGRRYAYGARQNLDATAVPLRGVIVRLRDDGSADDTFGERGVVTFPSATGPGSDEAMAVAEDVRGRLVLCGLSVYETPGVSPGYHLSGWVGRIGDDGVMDSEFGVGGVAVIDGGPGGTDGPMAFYAVALDGSRVVVAGSDSRQFQPPTLGVVAVLRDDGSLDPGFNHGDPYFDLVGAYYGALRVVPEGYVVAGSARVGSAPRVVRLRRDGVPDPSFGVNGAGVHLAAGAVSVRGLAITAEGITLAGASNLAHAVTLVRFDAAGRPVSGFGVGGVVTDAARNWDVGYEFNTAFVAQCDGRLLLLCQDSVGAAHLLRWNTDGTRDTTFAGSRDVTFGTADTVPVGVALTASGGVVALTAPMSIASQLSWWRLGR